MTEPHVASAATLDAPVIPNSRPKRHPEHPFSSPSERSLSLPRPQCRCRPRPPAGGPRRFALSSRSSAGCSRRRRRTPARRDGTTRRIPMSVSTPARRARCTDYERLGCCSDHLGRYLSTPHQSVSLLRGSTVAAGRVGAAATQTIPQGHSVQRGHCQPLPVRSGSDGVLGCSARWPWWIRRPGCCAQP